MSSDFSLETHLYVQYASDIMLTYILLFSLITLVILGVIRASKQTSPGARLQKEPSIGLAGNDIMDTIETVGKPRIISHNQTNSVPVISENTYTHTDAIEDLPGAEEISETFELSDVDAPPLFAAKTTSSVDESSTVNKNTSNDDVIVIHVIANPDHPYHGYELLQAMLTLGLRYGKWGIFHRHEEITGRGAILFSLASSIEPGTFDLAKMGTFSTPGLTLFMRTSTENAYHTFEKLLAAAQQLTKELGGTVCDEKRVPLSLEKIEKWRQICRGGS